MRIALIILLGIHGLIHTFGFLKAFGIFEFNALQQPISKLSGLFWLLAFLLFTVTLVLFLARSEYWWALGFVGVLASQILLFSHWSDAKFGTIANILILLPVIVAYSNYRFTKTIKQERGLLFNKSENLSKTNVSAEDIVRLPPIVQKWLASSGVVGKPQVSNVHLMQHLQLKLKPEQTDWKEGTAEQYFTIQPPAFSWNLTTNMNPVLPIVGRDKFDEGKGEMLIKLLSCISVANAKNNAKVDEATLQRYLAEMVWFPSATLSDYVQWEEVDNTSSRATMEFNGTKGSGIFYFAPDGQFEKFVAQRYKEATDKEPTEWTVTATKTEERNGIKIPTECEAHWNLDEGRWTWLKLKIGHIEYNVEGMPVGE